MTLLQKAAQAVIKHWSGNPQPDDILALRKALEAEQAQLGEPVAWVKEDELNDLSSCNGRSIWAESPSIWFDEVPEHLVPVYKHSYPLLVSEQAQAGACGYDESVGLCTSNPCCHQATPVQQAQAAKMIETGELCGTVQDIHKIGAPLISIAKCIRSLK